MVDYGLVGKGAVPVELDTSRSNSELSRDLLHAAIVELSENGGRLPSRDVVERAGRRVQVQGEECSIYPATGNTRWKAILQLQSIGLVKGGYIQKRKGIWSLTEEGEAAVDLSPPELWQTMKKRYQEWKQNQPARDEEVNEDLPDPDRGEHNESKPVGILTDEDDRALLRLRAIHVLAE